MSNKIGRNEPCPCASGKKYKRCCLAIDEAVAREHAQQALPDDEAITDDDDDELPFTLDVDAITSVTYTRGFVDTLSEPGAWRNTRVTTWEVPHIPQEVLDSIEREDLGGLDGEWGNPALAAPIQVDVIDVETEDEIVSIEMFNRGLVLAIEGTEELRRMHRACGVLEAAAPQGVDGSTGDGDERFLSRGTTAAALPHAFDLTEVLEQHQRLAGECALCGEVVGRDTTDDHLARCAPAHDAATGARQRLVQVRVTAPAHPAYWLDLEIRAEARLSGLDSLLRNVWVECCGHLSAFRIGDVTYFSSGYDFGMARGFTPARARRRLERSMSARLQDTVPPVGESFEYEYDFGSTTSLALAVTGERSGRLPQGAVRLLARNTPPHWPCAVCGQPADVVCTYCLYEDPNAFRCTAHREDNACGDDDGLMPVVNSPRTGVCGYVGEGSADA